MKARSFLLTYLEKWVDLGLMGVLVPEEYGGSGFGYHEYVTAL
jgi:alkylation response protein AidB-like acyl-CoA dehydrogenase